MLTLHFHIGNPTYIYLFRTAIIIEAMVKWYSSILWLRSWDYREVIQMFRWQGVRNSKKSYTRFHFFQDFKGFGWDFRFQNHRIRSVFDHVIFNIWRYAKIYSKEFAIRSHTNLCDTALRFAATLRWINGQYTEFTANF